MNRAMSDRVSVYSLINSERARAEGCGAKSSVLGNVVRAAGATLNGEPVELPGGVPLVLHPGDRIYVERAGLGHVLSMAPPLPASRQPPPELAARAAAFDRVLTALRSVAELDADDLELVAASASGAHTLTWLRGARDSAASTLAHSSLVRADAALDAELRALDGPEP